MGWARIVNKFLLNTESRPVYQSYAKMINVAASPHPAQRREQAGERIHIDVAGPMPIKSVRGKEYEYVVVDDHTRALYTKPLCLTSES